MARTHRAGLVVGLAAVLGGLYLLLKPKTLAASQGTGVQGVINASTGLIGTVVRALGGSPATGGTVGQSSASPPQNDPSGFTPPVDCADPANAGSFWCFDVNNPNNAPSTPPQAIPDFTPGGLSDDGSYYDSGTTPTPSDPTSLYGNGVDAFIDPFQATSIDPFQATSQAMV